MRKKQIETSISTSLSLIDTLKQGLFDRIFLLDFCVSLAVVSFYKKETWID